LGLDAIGFLYSITACCNGWMGMAHDGMTEAQQVQTQTNGGIATIAD